MREDTLLDDFVLSLEIAQKGYKIAYCKEAFALEAGSADLLNEEKRKIRIAAGGLQSVWRMRALLNPFRHGILSFQYISHRVLRWTLAPVMLSALFPINLILAYQSYNIIYSALFMAQIIFYAMAFAGIMTHRRQIKIKLLFIPCYFVFMNLNVIKAVPYLFNNKGKGIWEKVERGEVNEREHEYYFIK